MNANTKGLFISVSWINNETGEYVRELYDSLKLAERYFETIVKRMPPSAALCIERAGWPGPIIVLKAHSSNPKKKTSVLGKLGQLESVKPTSIKTFKNEFVSDDVFKLKKGKKLESVVLIEGKLPDGADLTKLTFRKLKHRTHICDEGCYYCEQLHFKFLADNDEFEIINNFNKPQQI